MEPNNDFERVWSEDKTERGKKGMYGKWEGECSVRVPKRGDWYVTKYDHTAARVRGWKIIGLWPNKSYSPYRLVQCLLQSM